MCRPLRGLLQKKLAHSVNYELKNDYLRIELEK